MRTHSFEKEHRHQSQPERYQKGQYNVCGVFIHTQPQHLDSVITKIKHYAGCEILSIEPTGRIGLTVEDTENLSSYDVLTQLQCDGNILNISLISHYFE